MKNVFGNYDEFPAGHITLDGAKTVHPAALYSVLIQTKHLIGQLH